VQLRLPTPLGYDLVVTAENDEIVASAFTTRKPERARTSDPFLEEIQTQVRAYFAKRLERFDLPLRLEGTALQVGVWRLVSQLSFGEVISYADVGRALGYPNAHRGVAAAMGHSPYDLFIPAHRVVGADMRIKGAAPNSMRRRLLIFEGMLSATGGDAIRPSGRSQRSGRQRRQST